MNRASNSLDREHKFEPYADVSTLKLAALNMNMCLSLHHDVICLFFISIVTIKTKNSHNYINEFEVHLPGTHLFGEI